MSKTNYKPINQINMAFIKTVEKEEATGKVAEIYDLMQNKMGYVPEAFKVFSSSEHVLERQFGNLTYFMRHPRLGGQLLAFIRVLVAAEEDCAYCMKVNSNILLQYGILPDRLAEIKADPSKAPMEEKDKQLLLFTLKVVKNSNTIQPTEIEKLRQLGWNDAEILEATYHAVNQVGADKIFNAFGVIPD
jgi:alkylhydroperoxidase family enzyme